MPIVSQVLDAGVILALLQAIRTAASAKNTAARTARMYLAATIAQL
jgi:hypothetical protein